MLIKRPLLFGFLSLLIGAILGISFLLLEKFAARELLALLGSEIEASGPFELKYDSADLSFLTLKAVAKNARIIQHSETLVLVPRLEAQFSLNRIWQKIADLEELKLIDAEIKGVGPDSAIFKVVNYLGAPLPPGQISTAKFKIKLKTLTLLPSSATDSIGANKLIFEGIKLSLQRDASNNFNLRGSIDKLNFQSENSSLSVPLANLSNLNTVLYLADDYVEIKEINIEFPGGSSKAAVLVNTKNHDSLSGRLNLSLDEKSIGLDKYFSSIIKTAADLTGTFSAPQLDAQISSETIDLLGQLFDHKLLIKDLTSALSANFENQQLALIINSITSSAESGLKISLEQPLKMDKDGLSGIVVAQLAEIATEQGIFRNIIARLKFNQSQGVSAYLDFLPPAQILAEKVSINCSYLNRASDCSAVSETKSLTASASLRFPVQSLPFIENGKLSFTYQNILSFSSDFSGPLNPELIKARARLDIRPQFLDNPVQIELVLDQGQLNASTQKDSLLQITAKSSLQSDAKTEIAFESSNLPILNNNFSQANLKCSQTSFKGNIRFPGADYHLAEGFVDISKLQLGCSPYEIKLKSPSGLRLKQGELIIPGLVLDSRYGGIDIGGAVSRRTGYSVKISGITNLSSFIPFVSGVEELSGPLNIDAAVSGPLNQPQVTGRVSLRDALLDITSPEIQVSDLNGEAQLNGNLISLKNLDGLINGGSFSVKGSVNLSEIDSSRLQADFKDVSLNPIENSELLISGNLNLDNSIIDKPKIRGNIEIESLQVVKRFNVLQALKGIPGELLGGRQKKQITDEAAGSSAVEMDLNIIADDALFFDSNFAKIEAKTSLHLSGPVSKPEVEGEVEILQGWFGLRDRRFDIGSGKIIFSGDSTNPVLEILAESSVFSRQGESVVIFASITGPASSPSIKLDSDRGYTEKEIINLLTSTSDITTTGNSLSMLPQDSDLELPFVSDDSFFGLGRWLRRLTKIDSISVEPSFNANDGVIEPVLVAEKKIWPNLNLRGETSFGASSYNARANLNYRLTSRVTLSGIIEALATQETTSLGVDAAYAFKPLKADLLRTSVSGNFFISTDSILQKLKLDEDSRVSEDTFSRLRSELSAYYFDSGFRDSEFRFSCEEKTQKGFCRNLLIDISEGYRLECSEIETSGDTLPEPLLTWFTSIKKDSNTATRQLKEDISSEMIARLRNEGYIRARVEPAYSEQDKKARLQLRLKLGVPVSFIFNGNKEFSERELLDSVNLFTRKQPFGNNTINQLQDSITRLYQQHGFLEAQVTWNLRPEDSESRAVYIIDIKEGSRLKVEKIRFSELPGLTQEALKELIIKEFPSDHTAILNPRTFREDLIENNCRKLESLLASEGYNNSTVSFSLTPNQTHTASILTYTLHAGPRVVYSSAEIVGVPKELSISLPASPLSLKRIEIFRNDLLSQLVTAGYYKAQVTVEYPENTNRIVFKVESGVPALIGQITISGLNNVNQQVVENNLKFRTGERLDQSVIAESRRQLLRTGLFAKAEIKEKDGASDSPQEDLLVKVEERNLQSMQVGAGLNSEYGFHVFGSAIDREFFSDGRSISARIDAYFDQLQGNISQGVISLNYADPQVIEPNIGLVSDLRYQRLDLNSMEFNLDRTSHALYLHRNFDENISGSLGHTIKFDNLDNVTPGAVLDPDYDTGSVRIGQLQSTLLFDYRDNPLNPRQGQAFSLSPQLASGLVGSEADFTSLEAKLFKIIPLEGVFDRFLLALNSKLASAWVFSGLDYIPITERFYSGGRTSVRGFRENSLGPKSEDGAIIGGDQLFTESLELRYQIIDDATINWFLDGGKLTLRNYSADGEDFRYSTGIGSRYLSPIGPIGFDVGFPLNEKSGEPSVRLHFSIGASF